MKTRSVGFIIGLIATLLLISVYWGFISQHRSEVYNIPLLCESNYKEIDFVYKHTKKKGIWVEVCQSMAYESDLYVLVKIRTEMDILTDCTSKELFPAGFNFLDENGKQIRGSKSLEKIETNDDHCTYFRMQISCRDYKFVNNSRVTLVIDEFSTRDVDGCDAAPRTVTIPTLESPLMVSWRIKKVQDPVTATIEHDQLVGSVAITPFTLHIVTIKSPYQTPNELLQETRLIDEDGDVLTRFGSSTGESTHSVNGNEVRVHVSLASPINLENSLFLQIGSIKTRIT